MTMIAGLLTPLRGKGGCPALIISTMPNKLRRGVLRTAAIGLKKVIPAMQQGHDISVVAIGSG